MKTTYARLALMCAILGAWTIGTLAMAAEGAREQSNMKTVLALTKAMAEQNVTLAATYLTDGYIQHNPNVPPGKAGYVKYFSNLWKDGPKPAKASLENPPVVSAAEGDVVVLVFRRPMPDPADPSKMYDSFNFDAYRLEKGKVAEHWDGNPKRAPTPVAAMTPVAPAPPAR